MKLKELKQKVVEMPKMTRQEAILRIKDHKHVHQMKEPRAIHITEALNMAIDALEKVDKLAGSIEQIKAEIEAGDGNWTHYAGFEKSLEIINKHLEGLL